MQCNNITKELLIIVDGGITRLCGQSAPDANSTALVPPSISREVLIRFHSSSQGRIEPRKRFAITVTVERTGNLSPLNCLMLCNKLGLFYLTEIYY